MAKPQSASKRKSQTKTTDDTSSKASQPAEPIWSAWFLHEHGRLYYRARRIPPDYVYPVENTHRSALVPDNEGGGFWHYEFIGTKELGYGQPDFSADDLHLMTQYANYTGADSGYDSLQEDQSALGTHSVESFATASEEDKRIKERRKKPYRSKAPAQELHKHVAFAIEDDYEGVIINLPIITRHKARSKSKKGRKTSVSPEEVETMRQISRRAKVDKWLNV